MRRMRAARLAAALVVWWAVAAAGPVPGISWTERTLASMSIEEKIGQLVMVRADSTFLSTDSDEFDRLRHLVVDRHVGGIILFGGVEPVPGVLLNPAYGSTILGDPMAAASLLNRLQGLAKHPLLAAGDFEFGVGMRIKGATTFPRAMAFGAAGDPALVEQAAAITAGEMRALGFHVNFAPDADVNNNARNPVINTRSFGEDPARVAEMAASAVRGLEKAGVLAVLKHFPGHGDTDVDTHLGLATVPHDSARLDAVELVPFRAGIAAGASAVMAAHLEIPALEPVKGRPASLSASVVDGLLRKDLGFKGLAVTDSMAMAAITTMASPGEAAVQAVEAGQDLVLDPPDPDAALDALAAAVRSGRLPITRVDVSVRRVLAVKERLRLPAVRTVDLARVPDLVGGRAHRTLAAQVSERALTRLRGDVVVAAPRTAAVLHLSVLDYPSNWRIAAPGRTFVPELRARWPVVTAVELSDRSTRGELDLVRAMAPRFDAIVIAVYVRAASGSGRLDLAPEVTTLLNDLARTAGDRPVVACLFGNPYVAGSLPQVRSVLLTFDFGDNPERAAVRAIAGEIPAPGSMPISLEDR
jgi:beta-N-acetylhexosaminidase